VEGETPMAGALALTPADFYRFTFLGSPVAVGEDAICYTETTVDEASGKYRTRLRRASVTGDGGAAAIALTHGLGSDRRPVRDTSPRVGVGGQIWLLSDRGGATEVWTLPLDGGEARRQSAFEGGRLSGLCPHPRLAEALVVVRPPRPEGEDEPRVIRRLRYRSDGLGFVDTYRRLYRVRADEGVDALTDGGEDVQEAVWSADGESVLFVADRRPEAEFEALPQIYRVGRGGGRPDLVFAGRGPIHDLAPSPDGRWLFFYGHEAGEDPAQPHTLLRLDLATGEVVDMAPDGTYEAGNHVGSDSRDDGGETRPVPLADGRVLWLATARGRSWLVATPMAGGPTEPAAGRRDESVSSFTVGGGGRWAVVSRATATDPSALEARALAADAGVRDHVVVSANAFLADRLVVAPEHMAIDRPDGVDVEGWLLRPPGEPPHPLVLEIHGGPHASYGHAFFLEFQILVGRGFAVLYTNPRGSAGYGAAFRRACVGDWGGADFADLMAAVDHAVAAGAADPARLGITGGSYGGFMTNWAVTQTDRFRAAVAQRSISNLHSMFGTSDIGFWFNKKELGGLDVFDDAQALLARSPLAHARRVRTPILILHSENDHRCPIEQAEQWFAALRRLGVECAFVRVPGEGHELSRSGRPRHRVARLAHIADWLATHIPARAAAGVEAVATAGDGS
jgi:dipeptidyl aminopeptidase/acylaminoacyl peptidase